MDEHFGVKYDMEESVGMTADAQVSTIFSGSEWRRPHVSSDDLVAIQSAVCGVVHSNSSCADKIRCTKLSSGSLNLKCVYFTERAFHDLVFRTSTCLVRSK